MIIIYCLLACAHRFNQIKSNQNTNNVRTPMECESKCIYIVWFAQLIFRIAFHFETIDMDLCIWICLKLSHTNIFMRSAHASAKDSPSHRLHLTNSSVPFRFFSKQKLKSTSVISVRVVSRGHNNHNHN